MILTDPTCVVTENILLSVPATIILLKTIFSVPRTIPFLHLTPTTVLKLWLTNFLEGDYFDIIGICPKVQALITYLDVSTAFSAYST